MLASELIVNDDGSIYHLNLHPQDVAPTIITVGDPDRVAQVSQYFDQITLQKGKREFVTHTGLLNGKPISVISTGIGTDNVDIVLNELDALFNIDFRSRQPKPQQEQTRLSIIRIGTSGSLQADIPVDSFLISETAIGLDGLLHFYDSKEHRNKTLEEEFQAHLGKQGPKVFPYAVNGARELQDFFKSSRIRSGITLTNSGFYGPQGRKLRLLPNVKVTQDHLSSFRYEGRPIRNLEMETAGIYGLAMLLGHQAVSLNAILANRATGTFSQHPQQTVDQLIRYCLEKLADQPLA